MTIENGNIAHKFLVTPENRIYIKLGDRPTANIGMQGLAIEAKNDTGIYWEHFLFLNAQESIQACYDWINELYNGQKFEIFNYNGFQAVQVFLDIHGLPMPGNAAEMPKNAEKFLGYSID